MSRNRNVKNAIKDHPLTNQRRLLLKLLQSAGGHIDAKELYRQASEKDSSISIATVYRSLTLFKHLGLVQERRLSKVRCYYEIKHADEHQHIICRGCGKVIEFRNPLLEKTIKSILRDNGFNITEASLYLEGNCTICEKNKKSADMAHREILKSTTSNHSN
jgi:Fur family ferric uptake transcriptional regulator